MKWLILLVLLTSVKSYAIGEANNEYYYDFCIKKKKKKLHQHTNAPNLRKN